jgi:hypothetical protein
MPFFFYNITRTYFINNPRVLIGFKLHFHHHVDLNFSHLQFIRKVTFHFPSLDSHFVLYFSAVIPQPNYASVVWNSVAFADARVQDAQLPLANF